MIEKMTLTSICSGAVQEKIDRALRAVGGNILDPNTDPKKKRAITLQITFQPKEDDREDVTVTVDVKRTLAPELGVRTQLFIAKDLQTGAMTIQEHQRGMIKGQLDFSDLEAMEQDDGGEYEPFDADTGEIYGGEEAAGGVLDFRRKQG